MTHYFEAAARSALSFETHENQERTLSDVLRPYALAMVLLAIACLIIYAGDSLLLRYGFPWALVSLLVVCVTATLCGARPAMLVLILSALFGDLIVPDLHISYFYSHGLYADVRVGRMLLFLACGASFVWLTDKAKQIQARSDRRWLVVEALQRMMAPATPSVVRGYDVFGVYSAARDDEEVGGDFYDIYPLGADRYGLLIGDVMGKGKEAAVHTAMLRYSVRAFASTRCDPAQILDHVSDLIERQGHDLGTASLFVGILDIRSHSLRYANAGHEPPLVCRAGGLVEALDVTGPILGATVGYEYTDRTVELLPGDAMLMMTDGVTEARNSRGQFMESEGVRERLRSALAAPSAESALSDLLGAVNRYIGHNGRDDIAMVLLRRNVGVAEETGSPIASPAVKKEIGPCLANPMQRR